MSYIQLLAIFLVLSLPAQAQIQAPKEKMTREEKDEKNAARELRIKEKNDYALFRKQITALPEFAEEKKKASSLQMATKTPVKVVIAIDSLDEGSAEKTLTGYIVQNIGDNATLMYDLTYDRGEKKIVSVKRTAEAIEADKAEKEEKEERAEKAAEKKTTPKPGVPKKKTDEDEDDADD